MYLYEAELLRMHHLDPLTCSYLVQYSAFYPKIKAMFRAVPIHAYMYI